MRYLEQLAYLLYFARADTARAHMHPYMRSMRPDSLYTLDIRFGNLLSFVVGMAHLIPAELALTADFTRSCHSDHLT